MSGRNQAPSNKHKVSHSAVAAGTGDANGAGIDMSNFEGVVFIAKLGAVVGGGSGSLKAQASDDDGSSDAYDDLKDTAVPFGDTDDGKLVILEVYRPKKKFIRSVVTRVAQNTTVESVVAVIYMPRIAETTEDTADVAGKETHASPDEGTA